MITRFSVAVLPLLLLPAGVSGADLLWLQSKSAVEHQRAVSPGSGVRPIGVQPVLGPVQRRFDPPQTRYGAGHRGVDIGASAGQPVVAAMGGTVTFAGRVAGVGWITVNHGGGLETTYGPVYPQLVDAGDAVAGGSVLGLVAAGSFHVDWGAKLDGAYIDPLGLLGGWETYLTTADEGPVLPALGGPAARSAATAAVPGRLVWPAHGPTSSDFGMRIHPVTGDSRPHNGMDIAAPSGAPIRAAAGGTVSFAGTMGGYGTTVTVDHGGDVTTLYAHQSSAAVSVGDTVAAGQLLGRVGATGAATGPHLHFEVRVAARPYDPAGWLRR